MTTANEAHFDNYTVMEVPVMIDPTGKGRHLELIITDGLCRFKIDGWGDIGDDLYKTIKKGDEVSLVCTMMSWRGGIKLPNGGVLTDAAGRQVLRTNVSFSIVRTKEDE